MTSWNTPVEGIVEPLPDPDPEGAGPIQVQLSQATIDNEFFGILDLTIGGLSLGQTVLVEKFRLDNDQGQINSAAVLLESHQVTDGIAVKAGEVFNFNLHNDVTPRDGQITTQLDFWEPDVASIPGEYLYRVTSPLGSFPEQSVGLTVSDVVTPQKFSGTVTSGGQPLAGATVALFDPLADTRDFIKGTTTDAAGNYTLYAPYEDEFEILAFKEGYVGPFSVGTEAVIEAGEEITIDLVLQEGTRTISGTLIDDASNEPLPGVQIFLFPAAETFGFNFTHMTTATTDAQGEFTVHVTPGRWGSLVRAQTAYKIGYLANNNYFPLSVADTTAGDVTDFEVPITRAGSMLWGRLLSDTLTSTEPETLGEPLPLCGVEVYAYDYDNNETAWGVTDGDGCYRIAVTPGRWSVTPYPLSLPNSDHSGTPNKELTITADNQSIEHDFFCRPTGGTVVGTITDEAFNPIGGLSLLALNADLDNKEFSTQATYQSDGFYFFDLPDGTWRIYPNVFHATVIARLFVNLPEVTIENGVTDDPIEAHIDVEDPTATIEITLTDTGGNPVPGAYVHGSATVAGFSVDSFAVTDATGVARLPAEEGDWELHFSDNFLRDAGMQALPAFHVTVDSEVAAVSQQVVPLTGAAAQITSVSTVGLDVEIEGTGESGQTYRIEASRDLENWFGIGSLRAVDGKFTVIDEFAALEERAYYRVITDSLGF